MPEKITLSLLVSDLQTCFRSLKKTLCKVWGMKAFPLLCLFPFFSLHIKYTHGAFLSCPAQWPQSSSWTRTAPCETLPPFRARGAACREESRHFSVIFFITMYPFAAYSSPRYLEGAFLLQEKTTTGCWVVFKRTDKDAKRKAKILSWS